MRQSIFSIDVEDWFNLSGTGHEPPPSEWGRLESRIERNFRGLLQLLTEGGGTETFYAFVEANDSIEAVAEAPFADGDRPEVGPPPAAGSG